MTQKYFEKNIVLQSPKAPLNTTSHKSDEPVQSDLSKNSVAKPNVSSLSQEDLDRQFKEYLNGRMNFDPKDFLCSNPNYRPSIEPIENSSKSESLLRHIIFHPGLKSSSKWELLVHVLKNGIARPPKDTVWSYTYLKYILCDADSSFSETKLEAVKLIIELPDGLMIENSSKLLIDIIKGVYPTIKMWDLIPSLIAMPGPNRPDNFAMAKALEKSIDGRELSLIKSFKIAPHSNLTADSVTEILNRVKNNDLFVNDQFKLSVIEILEELIRPNPSRSKQEFPSVTMTSTAIPDPLLLNKDNANIKPLADKEAQSVESEKPNLLKSTKHLVQRNVRPSDLSNSNASSVNSKKAYQQVLTSSPKKENSLDKGSDLNNSQASSKTEIIQSDSIANTTLSNQKLVEPASTEVTLSASSTDIIPGVAQSDSNQSKPLPPSANRKECLKALDDILLDLSKHIKEISPSLNGTTHKQALALCNSLKTFKKSYSNDLIHSHMTVKEAGDTFTKNCATAISEAKKDWADTIGFGDKLLNVLKAIYNAIVKIFSNNPHRLFAIIKPASTLKPVFEEAYVSLDKGIMRL